MEELDAKEAETLLRALASHYGGDPAATDISRLLRLPGFTDRKYNEAFVVRAHHEAQSVYCLRDFQVRKDSPDSLRHIDEGVQRSARGIPLGHRSQSEADWAYARRALARGDNAEQIIQRIADYRADDKADPYYYARLTVDKAQLAQNRLQADPSEEKAVKNAPSISTRETNLVSDTIPVPAHSNSTRGI